MFSESEIAEYSFGFAYDDEYSDYRSNRFDDYDDDFDDETDFEDDEEISFDDIQEDDVDAIEESFDDIEPEDGYGTFKYREADYYDIDGEDNYEDDEDY